MAEISAKSFFRITQTLIRMFVKFQVYITFTHVFIEVFVEKSSIVPIWTDSLRLGTSQDISCQKYGFQITVKRKNRF